MVLSEQGRSLRWRGRLFSFGFWGVPLSVRRESHLSIPSMEARRGGGSLSVPVMEALSVPMTPACL